MTIRACAVTAQRLRKSHQQKMQPSRGPIVVVEPLGERGNLSTDGTMILLRQEGWKEVKLTVISQVDVRPASARPATIALRGEDPWVRLRGHSCQAGLWDADTMGSPWLSKDYALVV
jgi:hypothetical protein